MDPTVIAAIFALVGSVMISAFSMRTSKGQLASSAGDNLRDDLLQRVEQLEGKVERQEAKIDELRRENTDLHHKVYFMTEWGRWVTGDVPRTPPHWPSGGASPG